LLLLTELLASISYCASQSLTIRVELVPYLFLLYLLRKRLGIAISLSGLKVQYCTISPIPTGGKLGLLQCGLLWLLRRMDTTMLHTIIAIGARR
jgi:hypothetical protein